MNHDVITVSGNVATSVRSITTAEGLEIASFRLASTSRRRAGEGDGWENGETNWYTVTCFRNLASNVAQSLRRGDPIVVSGSLRLRDWESDSKSGHTAEIAADAIGHDLMHGTTDFTRRRAMVIDGVETAEAAE